MVVLVRFASVVGYCASVGVLLINTVVWFRCSLLGWLVVFADFALDFAVVLSGWIVCFGLGWFAFWFGFSGVLLGFPVLLIDVLCALDFCLRMIWSGDWLTYFLVWWGGFVLFLCGWCALRFPALGLCAGYPRLRFV